MLTTDRKWLLQFDGGSRGNPGLGGSGAVIYTTDDNGELKEVWNGYFFVGYQGITNNVAEYQGLIEGLRQCVKMKLSSLIIQGDSQLILNQLDGIYTVKSSNLRILHTTAKALLSDIKYPTIQHIPREENKRADQLSNIAMDMKTSGTAYTDQKWLKSILPSSVRLSLPQAKRLPKKPRKVVEVRKPLAVAGSLLSSASKPLVSAVSSLPISTSSSVRERKRTTVTQRKREMTTTTVVTYSTETRIISSDDPISKKVKKLGHKAVIIPIICMDKNGIPTTVILSERLHLVDDDIEEEVQSRRKKSNKFTSSLEFLSLQLESKSPTTNDIAHNVVTVENATAIAESSSKITDPILSKFLTKNKLKGKVLSKEVVCTGVSSESASPLSGGSMVLTDSNTNDTKENIINVDMTSAGCSIDSVGVSNNLLNSRNSDSNIYIDGDVYSTVGSYVVRLDKPSALLKNIDKNNQLVESKVKKMEVSNRKPSLRSLQSLYKLVPIPLPSLLRSLKVESFRGKNVDEYLMAWALGYEFSTSLR